MDAPTLYGGAGLVAALASVVHTIWQMRKVNGTPENVDEIKSIMAEFLTAHAAVDPNVRTNPVYEKQLGDLHRRVVSLPPSVHKRR